MPRGNNPEAASEFRTQHGLAPNAEELIRQHRSSFPQRLRAAQTKRPDTEATDNLDYKALAKEADVERVEAATVYGDTVIYVYEDEDTRSLRKSYLDYDEGKFSAPEEDPSTEQQRANDEKQTRLREIVAEAERKADEARQKYLEEAQQEGAKAEEEQDQKVRQQAERAQKQEQDQEGEGQRQGEGQQQRQAQGRQARK